MIVAIDPKRNPLAGWDISISVEAEAKETIASVDVVVNESNQKSIQFARPTKAWAIELDQQGQVPGHNVVEVQVTSSDENTNSYYREWGD